MSTTRMLPRWMSFATAAIYSGLHERTLQNHAKAGLFRTSHVRAPGASRGRRLIDRASLDSFIEAGIGQVASIKMNEPR